MRTALTLQTTRNRCPFLPGLLKLPMNNKEALGILLGKGYLIDKFNIFAIARNSIGKAVYQHNHHPDNAPNFVDCASFVRWLYSHYGIWLPRYSISQHNYMRPITWEKKQPGDLVFCQGSYGKFWQDENQKVGHVGMITDKDLVIHAAGSKLGVVETSLGAFREPANKFRGVGRICNLNKTTVLKVRPGRLIETLEDLRWDILNSLGR